MQELLAAQLAASVVFHALFPSGQHLARNLASIANSTPVDNGAGARFLGPACKEPYPGEYLLLGKTNRMVTMLKPADLEPYLVRLLRCCDTRRYFKDGGWTKDPRDATFFAAETDAVRACVVNNLRNVELVLSTPGTYLDVLAARIR